MLISIDCLNVYMYTPNLTYLNVHNLHDTTFPKLNSADNSTIYSNLIEYNHPDLSKTKPNISDLDVTKSNPLTVYKTRY